MNYFAHLVLSQPTIESTVGNLLGDFARGIDQSTLNPAVRAGLKNHRAVDRFTDSHSRIAEIKQCFSPGRRRFAGIALDVYFDHLLMNHWRQFDARDVNQVIAQCGADGYVTGNVAQKQKIAELLLHYLPYICEYCYNGIFHLLNLRRYGRKYNLIPYSEKALTHVEQILTAHFCLLP